MHDKHDICECAKKYLSNLRKLIYILDNHDKHDICECAKKYLSNLRKLIYILEYKLKYILEQKGHLLPLSNKSCSPMDN